MTWFETLTGFAETNSDDVRSQLKLNGFQLTSVANNRVINAGEFTTPALWHVRRSIEVPLNDQRKIRIGEVVADVQTLHRDPENRNSVFQVASQFNCLEMASPRYVPEDGVGIYEHDRTQGPACCICAGAGTIYRNYFVELNGKQGQSTDNQIDCLSDIANHFDNSTNQYWRMKNGYCFPTDRGLREIEQRLFSSKDLLLDEVRGRLKVGVQSNTEITIGNSNHRVTQVFCSALPISYSDVQSSLWDQFPRLILDATYELTFYIALRNLLETGCPKLYLTLVGGGVFGNKLDWILSAIERSITLFAGCPLDVKIVSYGSSKPKVFDLVQRQESAQ